MYNSDTGALYFVTKHTVPADADIREINRAAQNGTSPFSGTESSPTVASDKDASDLEHLFEKSHH